MQGNHISRLCCVKHAERLGKTERVALHEGCSEASASVLDTEKCHDSLHVSTRSMDFLRKEKSGK